MRNIKFLTARCSICSRCRSASRYIDCTGLLHHLPDPGRGMRALASVLETDCGMA